MKTGGLDCHVMQARLVRSTMCRHPHQAGIAAPILLTLVRLLQGISIGGQLAGTFVHTVETAPKGYEVTKGSYSFAGVRDSCLNVSTPLGARVTLPKFWSSSGSVNVGLRWLIRWRRESEERAAAQPIDKNDEQTNDSHASALASVCACPPALPAWQASLGTCLGSAVAAILQVCRCNAHCPVAMRLSLSVLWSYLLLFLSLSAC